MATKGPQNQLIKTKLKNDITASDAIKHTLATVITESLESFKVCVALENSVRETHSESFSNFASISTVSTTKTFPNTITMSLAPTELFGMPNNTANNNKRIKSQSPSSCHDCSIWFFTQS